MEPPALPSDLRLEPAELLAHAPWVRRLARALVRDDATADDVEQQTWLAALTHPPRRGDPIRGWLRTIARNVVRKFGRDDAARRRRESEAAPREALPPVDDAVARAELHARIVALVLALDEPYRTTLIRRYFDELPPGEISRRDRVPLETVRTRLKRGLELVRGRVVAPSGSGEHRRELARALAPLLELPATGVTIMTATAWKLAGVAALVVAAALVGTRVMSSSRRGNGEPKVAAAPAMAVKAQAAETAQKPAPAPPNVVRAPDAERTRPDSRRLALHGFVVDGAGAPVPKAAIGWVAGGLGEGAGARDGRSIDQVMVTDSEFAIAGLPAGLVTFRVEAGGCQSLDATLDLSAADSSVGVVRHDFVVARSILLPVKLVTTAGEPFFTALRSARPNSEFGFHLAILVRDRPLPQSLPPLTASAVDVNDPSGRAFLIGGSRGTNLLSPQIPDGADGVIETARLPVTASLLLANVVLATQVITTADGAVTFTLDPKQIDAQMGRITAACLDAESGQPLKEARVQSGIDNAGGGQRPVREDGTFEIGPVAPGWIDVHISAPGHETWHRHVLVKPGKTTDLGDLELGRAIPVTGTVTSAAGKVVEASFGILCLDQHELGEPFYTHNYEGYVDNGKLVLSGLGRHRYVVAAMPGDAAPGAALFVVDLTSGVAPPPLDVRLEPSSFVRIQPRGFAPDEELFAELSTDAGVLVEARLVSARYGMYVTLPKGRYVATLFDGDRRVRSVSFDVAGAQIRVEFGVHDDRPARVVSVDPSHRGGILFGETTVTAPSPPASHAKAEPGLFLTGTVHDRVGAPIAGGRITVADGAGHSLRAETTSNGSFAVAGVAPGKLDVTAGGEACVDATQSIELAAGAPPRSLDFVLDRATRLQVSFTDLEGQPLEPQLRRSRSPILSSQIRVVASSEEPGAQWPPKRASLARWQAEFRPMSSLAGTLDVTAPLPVFVSAVVDQRVVATQRLDAPQDELTLAIDPKRLVPSETSARFRIVDARSAEPIVTAFAAVTQLSSMAGGEPRTLPSDADGVWTLDHLAPGRQLLCIRLANRQSMTFVVDLAEGQVNDLGDLQVLRDVELEGVVVDEQGQPSTAKLRAVPQGVDGEPQFDGSYLSVDPDRDGRFKFQATTPWLQLQPSSRDYAIDPLILDARLAPANGLKYVVKQGIAVTLRAKLEGGATRRVRLRRSDGVLLRDLTLGGAAPEQVRLVPGSYRAVMDGEGSGAATEKSFTVADAPVDVDLGR